MINIHNRTKQFESITAFPQIEGVIHYKNPLHNIACDFGDTDVLTKNSACKANTDTLFNKALF